VGFRCGCRFLPTCSDYALQCLHKHPFHRACWFIFKRLLRCQSLCKSGYDPIP
ncbi:MAG TPA: membrane protein insertion efficiency factor YidD, partial [Opitutae bacterium]|nr:membrane protein insertion efficiency factor YidD [Opitutae bacterium]